MGEETVRPVGVLALQGDFEAHRATLARLGAPALLVRSPQELEQASALILPGGESTTIGKLLERFGLMEPIRRRAEQGMPIWGTCAGLILMAREIEQSDQPRLGLMDIAAARNAFGRQVDSFEAEICVPALGETPVRGVFIRAPYVSRLWGSAEQLAAFQGRVVAVRQGNLLATSFHPELTDDTRFHQLLLDLARGASA